MGFIVLGILLFYMFSKLEKGIIIVLLLSPVLSIIEVGGQSITLYLQAFLLCVYLFKHYKSVFYTIKHNIFFVSSLTMMCSLFLSNFLSMDKHTPTMLLMMSSYFTIFILFDIFKQNIRYVNYFVNVAVIFAFVITINGLFETIFRYNILSELFVKIGIYPNNFWFVTGVRYGLKRAQSLFDMHTSLGGYCYIVFCFLLFLRSKNYFHKNVSVYLLILLIANLFFTGVRSAIIGSCIGIIPFINLKKFQAKHYLICFVFIVLVLPFLAPYLENIINSITQTDTISGSNTDMRSNQYEISLAYLNESFWFGNGISYTFNVAKMFDKELYGAESAWFPLMIDQGMLGCLAYGLLYISALIFVFKKHMKSFAWCVVGFLVFDSMSSIPRISLIYFFYYISAIYYILLSSKNDSFNYNTSLQCRKIH